MGRPSGASRGAALTSLSIHMAFHGYNHTDIPSRGGSMTTDL